MEINFTEDQVLALEKMISFCSGEERAMLLQGYAGTGKTTILKEFIKYLKKNYKPFVLCAPTHRARAVMEMLLGSSAITLHKLLCMTPNIDILELDLRELEFNSSDANLIPHGGIIIVDESSMISDSLYELLLKRSEKLKTKIIFVGDIAQLQPVKEDDVSKVFRLDEVATLSKIHRQSSKNALLPILVELRDRHKTQFETIEADEGSLITYNLAKTFMLEAGEFFKEAVINGDINAIKLAAFTNKRVTDLNNCMRKIVWRHLSANEYNLGEFLTGYDNFKYSGMDEFFNSSDYRLINEPSLVQKKLPGFSGYVTGYNLLLEDCNSEGKNILTCFILARNQDRDVLEKLISRLEFLRVSAIEAKNAGNKSRSSYFWKEYYRLNESFATSFDIYIDGRTIKKKTFDYGYASTVHKLQGCSLTRVFVDMANTFICRDLRVLRQLQYVALSRTRTDAHILI